MEQTEKVTFDRMPEALMRILEEIHAVRVDIAGLRATAQPSATRRPIDIEEVCRLIGKAKPTVYALACQRKIPCYKCGKKLYFYEDEILGWIESGRRLTNEELKHKAFTATKR